MGRMIDGFKVMREIKKLLPAKKQELYNEDGTPTQENLIMSCLMIIEDIMRED